MGLIKNISVEQVIKLAKKGHAQQEIAEMLGCSKQNISQLVQRYNIQIKKVLRWEKKPPEPKVCRTCGAKFWPKRTEAFCTHECRVKRFQKIERGLTFKDVRNIRTKYRGGTPVKDIAKEFEVTPGCIYQILQGRTFSYIK